MIQHNTILVVADKNLPTAIATKLLPLLQDHRFREFFSFITAYTDNYPATRTLILTGEYKENSVPGTLFLPVYSIETGVLQLAMFLITQMGAKEYREKVLQDFRIAPASFPHPYPVYYETPPGSPVFGLLWSIPNPVKLHLMQVVRACGQVATAPTMQGVSTGKIPQKIALP